MQVLADAADEDVVLAGGGGGQGIGQGQRDRRRPSRRAHRAQSARACSAVIGRSVSTRIDSLCDIGDRHAHAGRADVDRGVAHDLAGLVDHLHLFLGVAARQEVVDLGDAVADDRMRELGRGGGLALRDVGLGLGFELVDALLAGARDRLIGARRPRGAPGRRRAAA